MDLEKLKKTPGNIGYLQPNCREHIDLHRVPETGEKFIRRR